MGWMSSAHASAIHNMPASTAHCMRRLSRRATMSSVSGSTGTTSCALPEGNKKCAANVSALIAIPQLMAADMRSSLGAIADTVDNLDSKIESELGTFCVPV